MAAPAKRLTAHDARVYEVLWKTETIGFAKDVDPSGVKLLEREKRIGELNDLLVDVVTYGMEGGVKMTLHEVDVERLRQLMPWATSSGVYPLAPTTVDGDSQYARAGILRLHPKGDAGTTNDIVFLKAFPKVSLPKSGGGKNYREIGVEWTLFPDQTALTSVTPTVVYGYMGDPPA